MSRALHSEWRRINVIGPKIDCAVTSLFHLGLHMAVRTDADTTLKLIDLNRRQKETRTRKCQKLGYSSSSKTVGLNLRWDNSIYVMILIVTIIIITIIIIIMIIIIMIIIIIIIIIFMTIYIVIVVTVKAVTHLTRGGKISKPGSKHGKQKKLFPGVDMFANHQVCHLKYIWRLNVIQDNACSPESHGVILQWFTTARGSHKSCSGSNWGAPFFPFMLFTMDKLSQVTFWTY